MEHSAPSRAQRPSPFRDLSLAGQIQTVPCTVSAALHNTLACSANWPASPLDPPGVCPPAPTHRARNPGT
eukprot:2664804-Rhodomonas_salina.1